MARVLPLDALGIAPETFYLPHSVPGLTSLRYYLIVRVENPSDIIYASPWAILAVGTLPDDPHGLLLRQLLLDEKAMEWEQFNGWADGSGYFSASPAELAALRDFFLTLAEGLPAAESPDQHGYFSLTPADAYVACGIPAGLVDHMRGIGAFDGRLYRYTPDTTITPEEAHRFLFLSTWSSTNPQVTSMTLVFQAHTPARITAIQDAWSQHLPEGRHYFEVGMMDGDGALHVSRGALRALARLLDEQLDRLGHEGAAR